VVQDATQDEPPPQIIPMESEVMPAETVGSTLDFADAPVPRPPRRIPWVAPGEAGAASPYAWHQTNTWGWNIPSEQPRTASDRALGASNNAVVNTHYSGPGGPVDWSESRFYGVPASLGAPVKTKWGWVAFDFGPAEFWRCTWDTIPVEHGLYLTGWGQPVSWIECLWEDVYGQAIQVVYSHPKSKRAAQTGVNAPREWYRRAREAGGSVFEIDRCETRNVGIPPLSERGSFTWSFFAPNGVNGPAYNYLSVTRSRMETSYPWTDVNGIYNDSAGAIMGQRLLGAQIRRNLIVYRFGDRDVIQLWACSDGKPGTVDVEISENYILARKPIDIRLGNANDTILIRRNVGNAEVVISTNPWYVWQSNGWDESKVIYRGPISDNYRLN
jgi:hypothetical protein